MREEWKRAVGDMGGLVHETVHIVAEKVRLKEINKETNRVVSETIFKRTKGTIYFFDWKTLVRRQIEKVNGLVSAKIMPRGEVVGYKEERTEQGRTRPVDDGLDGLNRVLPCGCRRGEPSDVKAAIATVRLGNVTRSKILSKQVEVHLV